MWEAYCYDCNETFNPDESEQKIENGVEHYECQGTHTRIIGKWGVGK